MIDECKYIVVVSELFVWWCCGVVDEQYKTRDIKLKI